MQKNATPEPHIRIPWHRNPKIRALVFQVAVVAFFAWAFFVIFTNTITNLESRGIHTGFSFLNEVAPFNVGFSPFIEFQLGSSTYLDIFLVGILNTILVSVLGIFAATILGFLIGVMRLSKNWLTAKLAAFYIETFRNIPLLLQIMFWNFAVFLPLLPHFEKSWHIGESAFLSNRGLYLAKPILENGLGLIIMALLFTAALVGAFLLSRWARRRQELTGQTFPVFSVSLLALIVVPGAAYLLFSLFGATPFSFEKPVLGLFNFEGGMQLPLPLFSLWFALTTYTASFIAEAVRGGILAVSHGQTEAAHALGLSRSKTLRLVTIPQAMRVIIPPTISQFLNLTKNSSLAVAIAYEELVSLWSGIALNQTGQALIIIAMTIAVYETLSIVTSIFLNWYNKHMQLVER